MMTGEQRPRPEVARPYFEQQAQLGRPVIFRWRPSEASPHHPFTQPWPAVAALIEGVEVADEAAAQRFDLDCTAGPCGCQAGGDVPVPGYGSRS